MGAKFSGGGATVFYDDGIKTAASGTTGTQRNEFEAAIKSVTSSTTVGAVFLYDTSQDSDGGKWRKKCKGLSWFDEAASATRSARSEFPAMALIVADNGDPDGTARTLKIYDLDDPAMPLWMQFDAASNASKYLYNTAGTDISSLFALNGRIYVAALGGAYDKLINFAEDELINITIAAEGAMTMGQIANRNATGYTSWVTPFYPIDAIVNNVANDVAMTVLEGAEIGALGLPIPTVAVATDSGISVIHGGSGAVYDISSSTTHNDYRKVFFTDDGRVGTSFEASGSFDVAAYTGLATIPFADNTSATSTAGWVELYNPNGYNGLTANPTAHTSANATVNAVTPTGKDGLAIGYPAGLSVVKRNTGNDAEGAVAYITADYNTGYMVGDIRLAALTKTNLMADRSVKGNTLTENGSLSASAVASGAELFALHGFSTSNYLSRAYDADFNFSTTDFSIMFWVKFSGTGVYDTILERAHYNGSAYSGNGFYIETGGSNAITFKSDTGGITIAGDSSTSWQQIVFARRGSTVYGYRNGVLAISGTDARDFDNTSATLRVGGRLNGTGPADGSSLSLLRISATAPTPQQIKEIYEAEKPLFQAGAKCLLASTHGSESNIVHDLAFDKSTELLTVSQSAITANPEEGVQKFRGLERVAEFDGQAHGWNFGSSQKNASAGGVSAYFRSGGTNNVLVDLPALDVRAELNDGDDKLTDDGKLHFEGVTTDATPTVIGFIPMAENEWYSVRARVTSIRHNNMTASAYHTTTIEETFYRIIGGDINSRGQISKLTDEITASLDFDLTTTTAGGDSPASVAASSNYIMLRVTGYSALNIQWKASVEVQRISEKLYER